MMKRSRNINFSRQEEELLVELVTTHKNIIENKKTGSLMWKEKEACWAKLSSEFNSRSLLVPRTVGQLQWKYKNIKKVVQQKSVLIKLEHLKTDGGKNDSLALNEVEEKVKDIMQLSVEGMSSHFDCDIEADDMPSVCDVTNEVYDNFAMIEDDDDSYFVTGRKTTNLLQHKDKLMAMQIKCLEQEVEINEIKKRNVILEEEKLKLEIELLKKKVQM